MCKVSLELRSFVLFSVVVIGIITRLMIGYTAFANPLHRHAGASLQAPTSEVIEVTDSRFHSFKLKRKIALETVTHFLWHLPVPTLVFIAVYCKSVELTQDQLEEPFQSPRLRPPAQA